MADTHDTIADIVAVIRRRSDEAYKGSFNYPECQEKQIEYDEASDWADRLEAAAKRMECTHKKELETRDAVIQTEVAAREAELDAHKREMKETVRRVSQVAEEMTRGTAKGVAPTRKDVDEWAVRLYDIIDITLLAPARNCDRFKSCDVAKLREALISLRDAIRDFRHQVVYTKYNDIMDEYTCREKGIPAVLTLRDAIPKANLALAAPPRNCDLYKTKEKAQEAFLKEPCDHPCGNCLVEDINNECGVEWLLAPATEKKGLADGNK